jgi:hypothetical protein
MFTTPTGLPVTKHAITLQFDIPAEQAGVTSLGTVNWLALIGDVISLASALASANPATVAAAIQQLITDIVG